MKTRVITMLLLIASLFLVNPAVGAGLRMVDGTGETVGWYLDRLPPPQNSGSTPLWPEGGQIGRYDYLLVSSRGFKFAIAYQWELQLTEPVGEFPTVAKLRGFLSNGINHLLYFLTPDCTGQAYAQSVEGGFVSQMYLSVDLETTPFDPPQLWYAEKTALPEVLQLSSVIQLDGSCFAEPGGLNRFVVPVFPNDPSVTGVSGAEFPLPLSFEPIAGGAADCTFSDRFECPTAD